MIDGGEGVCLSHPESTPNFAVDGCSIIKIGEHLSVAPNGISGGFDGRTIAHTSSWEFGIWNWNLEIFLKSVII